jgi:predicted nucleic acid-binding protein
MVMVVIDASALIEALLQTPRGKPIAARMSALDEPIHVPHLIDLEVVHYFRKAIRIGTVGAGRAQQILNDFSDIPAERYDHFRFLHRIWQLRDSVSAYDAAYVALAEALDARLLTCDAKLAAAHGHRAEIELV